MGRKYHCDFCNVGFKDDLTKRKNHLNGLKHKQLRNQYYEQFKDPRQILREQSFKKPCSKIMANQECKFGSFCRFSHYTPSQLANLQRIVEEEDNYQQNVSIIKQPAICGPQQMIKTDIVKEVLSDKKWKYPEELKNMSNLPPSLWMVNLQSDETNQFRNDWG